LKLEQLRGNNSEQLKQEIAAKEDKLKFYQSINTAIENIVKLALSGDFRGAKQAVIDLLKNKYTVKEATEEEKHIVQPA
jgi:hypothetical protein